MASGARSMSTQAPFLRASTGEDGGSRSGALPVHQQTWPGDAGDLSMAYTGVLGWLNMCVSEKPELMLSKEMGGVVSEPARQKQEEVVNKVVESPAVRPGEYSFEVKSSGRDLFSSLRDVFSSNPCVEVLEVNTEAMTLSVIFCEDLAATDLQARVCQGERGASTLVLSHCSRRDVVRFRRCVGAVAEALQLQVAAPPPGAPEVVLGGGAGPLPALGLDDGLESFFEDEFEEEADAEEVDWPEVLTPLLNQACAASASRREDSAQQLALLLRANPACRRSFAELLVHRPEVVDSLFLKPMQSLGQCALTALATLHCSASMLLLASTAEAMGAETVYKLRSMTAGVLLAGTAKTVERDLTQVLQNLRAP
mmetsp:Transcript_1181/g.2937  ORF Transcript_1181/g.2937 Transcript_1181/m.2937 type:complete len:368 (-) Transcript_1181:196-1299(-)